MISILCAEQHVPLALACRQRQNPDSLATGKQPEARFRRANRHASACGLQRPFVFGHGDLERTLPDRLCGNVGSSAFGTAAGVCAHGEIPRSGGQILHDVGRLIFRHLDRVPSARIGPRHQSSTEVGSPPRAVGTPQAPTGALTPEAVSALGPRRPGFSARA